jgi:hypothetical protein
MSLTHSLRVSIILALAAACSARDVTPPSTAPPYTESPYTQPSYTGPKSTAPYTKPPHQQSKSTRPRTEPPSAQPFVPTPHYKDPGVVCLVPDFSAEGPLIPGEVTPVRDNTGPDYAEVKLAQEHLDQCNSLQSKQEHWALNVLSCFDNPSAPVWREVHWRCLIGKVTVPFPRKEEPYAKYEFTAWIPETRQVSLGIYCLIML